jgi:hypothetical protein
MRWKATPRERRMLADVAHVLSKGGGSERKIALMVGAGLDRQLTGRSLWPRFVRDLGRAAGLRREELDAIELTATEYPVEAAEALRIAIGRNRYHKVLREVTRTRNTRGERMASALKSLVELGINLIVTFNYTRDLEHALPSNREIIVIQRNHLPGWSKLDLLHPEGGKIHILAMHGVVDEQLGVLDSAILDSRSYDTVMFSDFHYADVLQRLFQDYTVISIGLSWKDVMLRHAAARVHFSSPLYGRTHAAILPRAEGAGCRKRDVWQERSLVSAYSLRPLYYDPAKGHAELVTLLDDFAVLVGDVRSNIPPAHGLPAGTASHAGMDALARMAETLDACGDHECVFQREWFGAHWARTQAGLETAVQHGMTTRDWISAARIERHLRHFLWAYVAPERRDQERKRLWTAIAETGMRKHKAGELREWSSLALAVGPHPTLSLAACSTSPWVRTRCSGITRRTTPSSFGVACLRERTARTCSDRVWRSRGRYGRRRRRRTRKLSAGCASRPSGAGGRESRLRSCWRTAN